MARRFWILFALISLCCSKEIVESPSSVSGQAVASGGEYAPALDPGTVEAIRGASQVTVYRIQSPFTKDYEEARKSKPLAGGYPMLAEASLDVRYIPRLRELILAKSTYGSRWSCIFDPGYVASFRGKSRSVDVTFCFKCSDLFVSTGPGAGVSANFMPAARELRTIVMSPWPQSPTGVRRLNGGARGQEAVSVAAGADNNAAVVCQGQSFYRPGGAVKAAVPIKRFSPRFDTAAAGPWLGSIVLLEARVDQNGNICDAVVVWHATPAIEQVALRAFRQWKFRPAMLNGRAVNSVFSATFPIRGDR